MDNVETMAMLTGYGFKLNQKYTAFDRKGWSISPTIGVGYQKLCMSIDGEISDSNARITSFNDKVCSNNFYTDFLIGVEKELRFSRNSLYFGLNIGARKIMDNTTKTAPSDGGYVDWSATNTGGFVMELTFRASVF